MQTAQSCRDRAAEAERLALLVSYERDRTRLQRQAQEWRDRADQIESQARGFDAAPPPKLLDGVRRWLRLKRR